MKKHYWQRVRLWRSPLLLPRARQKTTNRSICLTGGTRVLTWWAATTPVLDRRSVTIPTGIRSVRQKDWFDFYGYIDAPVFFGGNSTAKGIWNKGSPLFMEIEPRFSIDKLTNTDLSFGPFKEWYFANNYIYDMGRNDSSRAPVYGSGYRYRYRPANEPVAERLRQVPVAELRRLNENEWDGYRFKVKYFVPLTDLWGGSLSYIGFTNFDWGSDLGDDNFYDLNGKHARTSNSIASSHIHGAELRALALLYRRPLLP